MRFPQLDKRMTIEAETLGAADGQGGFAASTWSTFDHVWANLKPIRASDDILAQGEKRVVTHRLTIRHRPDVSAAVRFTLGDRVFNPHGPPINLMERDRFLEFTVTEEAG